MFGRLVNLACSRKALLRWSIVQKTKTMYDSKISQLGILRIQEAKPFREVHLWNEVQPMSPLSLNHDHLIRSQNHVCTVLEGNSRLKQSFIIIPKKNKKWSS